MAGWWRELLRTVRRYPWPTNVLLYAALFSAGDALQQRLRGGPADWRQTRHVATVAVAFHANFNYVWLRLLERALPGRAPRAVLAKVLCDQAFGGPVYVSAFYFGMSILQEKDDIFLDLRQKFWNSYKSGLMYWPFVQSAVPGPGGGRDGATSRAPGPLRRCWLEPPPSLQPAAEME
ncbi:mpv17-like protein isoform X2 [Tursiops truncatus]|uniref:mpv17-like protein isoform X2 n=1 Tax=Tursiops truncatus TaxID=9739 RepID=UPI003CCF60CB